MEERWPVLVGLIPLVYFKVQLDVIRLSFIEAQQDSDSEVNSLF